MEYSNFRKAQSRSKISLRKVTSLLNQRVILTNGQTSPSVIVKRCKTPLFQVRKYMFKTLLLQEYVNALIHNEGRAEDFFLPRAVTFLAREFSYRPK